MKKNWLRFSLVAVALGLLTPVALHAQKEEKEEKTEKDKKEVQEIIVSRKADTKDNKVIIEINGDKVTVNGKPLEEYKDRDGDLNVRVNRVKDPSALAYSRVPGFWNGEGKDNIFTLAGMDENRAMLGVSTQKTDNGVEVQTVTKESSAEKAGLKEHDIITMVDDKKIEDPDDLSTAIQKHKPGEKLNITYLRDKKEQKTTVELGKWKGLGSWTSDSKNNFKFNDNFSYTVPDHPGENRLFSYNGGSPKLGLSVQDSEDGKGVKVIDVDAESNAAKAGLKESDLILEADGKPINNTDDMVKVVRESKDKQSISVKYQRDGKSQNVDVKIPHRLKSANL